MQVNNVKLNDEEVKKILIKFDAWICSDDVRRSIFISMKKEYQYMLKKAYIHGYVKGNSIHNVSDQTENDKPFVCPVCQYNMNQSIREYIIDSRDFFRSYKSSNIFTTVYGIAVNCPQCENKSIISFNELSYKYMEIELERRR